MIKIDRLTMKVGQTSPTERVGVGIVMVEPDGTVILRYDLTRGKLGSRPPRHVSTSHRTIDEAVAEWDRVVRLYPNNKKGTVLIVGDMGR